MLEHFSIRAADLRIFLSLALDIEIVKIREY